jgi:cobalt/nickel transport system permease protein
MAKIIDSMGNIRFLDELSSKTTIIHLLNPVVKLIVTLIYSSLIVSFHKYDIIRLLPYVFYPIIIFNLAEIPFIPILKRVLFVFPIVIGIGIFNPIFDKEIFINILGVPITAGWISFASLLIKCLLTVLAALLLISTTKIEAIAYALRKLFVPKIFIMQLLFTYRYIYVLVEEVSRVLKAYHLRSPVKKGVFLKDAGSLLGQILLRSFDKATRIYNAMRLRGFEGEYIFDEKKSMNLYSISYLLLWTVFFGVAKIINIPEFFGNIIMGVIS